MSTDRPVVQEIADLEEAVYLLRQTNQETAPLTYANCGDHHSKCVKILRDRADKGDIEDRKVVLKKLKMIEADLGTKDLSDERRFCRANACRYFIAKFDQLETLKDFDGDVFTYLLPKDKKRREILPDLKFLTINNEYNGTGAVPPLIHLEIAIDYMKKTHVDPEKYLDTPIVLVIREVDGMLRVGMVLKVAHDVHKAILNAATIPLTGQWADALHDRKKAAEAKMLPILTTMKGLRVSMPMPESSTRKLVNDNLIASTEGLRKGVVAKIIPDSRMPEMPKGPNGEKIEVIMSPESIATRMGVPDEEVNFDDNFKTIMLGKKLLKDCPFRELDCNARLYYLPRKENNGFDFYVANFVSACGGGESNRFEDYKELSVECLFEGVAYFDGVRHIYMGSEKTDNYGYIYYPCMKHFIKIMEILSILEHKYCNPDMLEEPIGVRMNIEAIDIMYMTDLEDKLPPREEVEKVADPIGLLTALTRTEGSCRTDGMMFNSDIKDNKISYELELPEGKEPTEAMCKQLEEALHNAAEAILQQLWIEENK